MRLATILLMMAIWSYHLQWERKDMDKETRIVNVNHPKLLSIPKVGDIIIGTVAAVMSSMVAITIDYINGKSTTSKVECICATRNMRIRNVALV